MPGQRQSKAHADGSRIEPLAIEALEAVEADLCDYRLRDGLWDSLAFEPRSEQRVCARILRKLWAHASCRRRPGPNREPVVLDWSEVWSVAIGTAPNHRFLNGETAIADPAWIWTVRRLAETLLLGGRRDQRALTRPNVSKEQEDIAARILDFYFGAPELSNGQHDDSAFFRLRWRGRTGPVSIREGISDFYRIRHRLTERARRRHDATADISLVSGNGDFYAGKPSRQNAWRDIGPLLMECAKLGATVRFVVPSSDAWAEYRKCRAFRGANSFIETARKRLEPEEFARIQIREVEPTDVRVDDRHKTRRVSGQDHLSNWFLFAFFRYGSSLPNATADTRLVVMRQAQEENSLPGPYDPTSDEINDFQHWHDTFVCRP